MHHSTPSLSDRDVLNHAQKRIQQTLKLKADGYACTTTQLVHVLLGMAATRQTLEAVCAELETGVCAATLRGYLNEQLTTENLPQVEKAINAALAQSMPASMKEGARELAIDYHDQSYYGKSEQEQGLWVRAEAKDGTTRVYRVATSYIIRKGWRLTLSIRFVRPEDDHVSVLQFLLKGVKALAIRVGTLYLDRGFAGGGVIKYLQKTDLKAVIACPIRGKRGGVRALCVGQKSYLTEHTFNSPQYGQVKIPVAICRGYTTAKRTGRKEKKAQWLVFILVGCQLSAQMVRQKYRRRFGIETSYRCSRQVRGWTSSNRPTYRFLLIGMSFLLLNVWMELRWLCASKPRRGGRHLVEAHFRLRRCARFIMRALETMYGCVSHVEVLSTVTASR